MLIEAIKKADKVLDFIHLLKCCGYSLRSDSTGSFFAAMREGMRPAKTVRTIEMRIRIRAASHGNCATPSTLVVCATIALIGKVARSVMAIPSTPEINPSMAVSAVKMRRMSFFEAPIARRIPISFVRSRTEMYVIIAIIIDDTMSEMATKPTSTVVITLTIVVIEDMMV